MPSESLPTFSIIVPTYNRPLALAQCLEAVADLDYPRDCYEVIVVDDGGSSPLEPIIEQLSSQIPITLLRQINAGPAQARNTGAAQAAGEFIALTDDDCLPEPGWLRGFLGVLQSVPGCLAGGRTVNHLPHNLASSASQHLHDYIYSYYNRDPLNAFFFASNNMAVARKGYEEIGGFASTFRRSASEDRDLCDRWLLAGHRLCYAPEAVVRHAHDLTLASFWGQHFNYGRGAFTFHQHHAARRQALIRIEPPGFYLKMLWHPFLLEPPTRAAIIGLLIGVSQVANALGFFGKRWGMAKKRLHTRR